MVKRPTEHVAVCDYMLQRRIVEERTGGWVGMWGWGGGRLEREREVYSCSLLSSDVCFPTHLRLGVPGIFWCCIPCSECCNLLCVGLNVHILGNISYFIRQLLGMCSCCIVISLKHL